MGDEERERENGKGREGDVKANMKHDNNQEDEGKRGERQIQQGEPGTRQGEVRSEDN